MSDPRETILARLMTVFAALPGYNLTARNPTNVPDELPAIVLFDGDEQARDEGKPTRFASSPAPIVMMMRPEIYVRDSRPSADIGTTINAHRAAIVKAVLTDATLFGLTYHGRVFYRAAETGLTKDRKTFGEILCAFEIDYLLEPNQL